MTLLILGLVLWTAAHFFKRVAPDARARLSDKMGDASKGLFAVLIVASVVLMVIGYRGSEFVPVWYPPSFMGHINNLLMLLAFYIYGASAAKPAKVWIGTKIRHPQLVGFSIWAVAHLLANGDLSSIILFGGLLVWAQISIQMINGREGPWHVPAQAPIKKEITLVVITLVLYSVVSGVHIWLGVNPFGGV
ncbi:putative membrane protein [Litoreibacter ponti]|uniref:Putative membrane protein n=1 Tax=Litoreibacter ponti TaxID=1510457 RepID=A0A2T6BM79_9RHOB|nr:NnrU family protein [Litoreibacter ponti]PTX57166.1 putative membrane protein [Litoreibacter ponti]